MTTLDKDGNRKKDEGTHGSFTSHVRRYIEEDIWCQDTSSNRIVRTLKNTFRKICIATELFLQKDLLYYAASLAFNTVLAIVPTVAMIIAVSRGFGYSGMAENLLRWILSSQQDAADYIIRFANSYLTNAQGSAIIGFGIIVMLYSVISLINNIETVFDSIWNVKESRGISRKIINYLSMFFMVPITIVLISGVNIALNAYIMKATNYTLLAPIVKFLIHLIPIIVTSVVFLVIYVTVPNTKVRIGSALIPSILAAVFMMLLQQAYIIGQSFLSGYNAIYGSLAAVPLFMIWVQLSWYIILFFAELCYTNQYQELMEKRLSKEDISYEDRMVISSVLLSLIFKRFKKGLSPYSALELKESTHLPLRLVIELLNDLHDVGILDTKEERETTSCLYYPLIDISSVNLGVMVERLSHHYKSRKVIDTTEIIDKKSLTRMMKSRDEFLSSLSHIDICDISDSK